jgi:hypothetical protein
MSYRKSYSSQDELQRPGHKHKPLDNHVGGSRVKRLVELKIRLRAELVESELAKEKGRPDHGGGAAI